MSKGSEQEKIGRERGKEEKKSRVGREAVVQFSLVKLPVGGKQGSEIR